MTTELERLKAWMDLKGYDSASLSAALEYGRDWLANILNGSRPIRYGLHVRFCAVFGVAEYVSIFSASTKHLGVAMNRFPEQTMAQMAVVYAVQRGTLAPAHTHKCHGCDKQAQQFHHESYHPNDRLCVVPLCRSCHRQHHTGRKVLTFGVVPTSVGLVRIAIAGL